jgi:hypothetical protein
MQTYDRPMLRPPAAVLLLALGAAACSPTFDWREVRVEPTRLKAMLPCKPDAAARKLPMGSREVEVRALGCEAGTATYAILTADVGEPARADEALAQWNRATLANLRGTVSRTQPFIPARASALPSSLRVTAEGRRADGSAIRGEAAYFAQGTRVFQAVVYGAELRAEMLQPFFEGLRLE